MQRHEDAKTLANAWKLRKAGEPLLHGVPGDRKPVTFVEDTAVDPVKLSAFVDEFRAIVASHGTKAAYYAHASVGCLHIRPLVQIHDAAGRAEMVSIATKVADLVQKYGGALSGEHGDGRVRTPLLDRVLGATLCEAFRQVKAVFDPEGRMNPGNLVDVGNPNAIVERLRVKPGAQDIPVPDTNTFVHYDHEHGFDAAVEACNGAGLCRRVQPGGLRHRRVLQRRHRAARRHRLLLARRRLRAVCVHEHAYGVPSAPRRPADGDRLHVERQRHQPVRLCVRRPRHVVVERGGHVLLWLLLRARHNVLARARQQPLRLPPAARPRR
jgi:hypothetical protein